MVPDAEPPYVAVNPNSFGRLYHQKVFIEAKI